MESEKKSQGLVLVFVVVLILLITAVGYIVYDKMNETKQNDNDVQENENNNTNVNDNQNNDDKEMINDENYNKGNLSVDDSKVVELYKLVTGQPVCYYPYGDNIADYYIDGKISNNVILNVGFKNAVDFERSGVITASELKSSIEKAFGEDQNENGEYLYKADVYADYQKTKKIANDIKYVDLPKISSYLDKASTYQYTFTLENGNYYFTDFKKIG